MLLAACGGPDLSGPPPGPDARTLRLDRDSVTLLIGEAVRFRPALSDAAGNAVTPDTLLWMTRDRAVASISADGIAVATGLGDTWVLVSDGARLDSARVRVRVRFTSVHAGTDASCGTASTGPVLCWGWNEVGSLGTGDFIGARTPVVAAGGRGFASIESAGGMTCARTGVAVWCWGYNGAGQLADGSITSRPDPVRVAAELDVAALFLGAGTTPCLRTETGEVHCWGWNIYGQLLNGSRFSSRRVIPLAAPLPLVSVSAGGGHACGLDAGGAAWCWGRGELGQLGDGGTASLESPVPVTGGLRFDWLTTGMEHTCGRANDGTVWCWGGNRVGQLGSAAGAFSAVPVRVGGLPAADTLVATRDHACILSGGAAWCWGGDAYGQLGSGAVLGASARAVEVRAPVAFRTISAGTSHTCAMGADGTAWCWGRNRYGALGTGSLTDTPAAVAVAYQDP